MKIMLIVNPTAGKGKAGKMVPLIENTMKNSDGASFDISFTKERGHATEIARSSAEDGYDIVYAVGGDGTVNEVMNGLIGTKSALAVLPVGSGNDFARSLGISENIEEAIRQSMSGNRKLIDVGIINGRHFINISSVGFDAEVVLATQNFKKLLFSGSAAYVAGLISTIFTNKPRHVKISVDGNCFEKCILLAAVANGKYYGGGMMAAPDAVMDDGKFDVCIIEKVAKIKMLFLFPKFMKGEHKAFKEVSFLKSEKVEIESQDPIAINVDGEVFKDTRVCFDIVKNGLYMAVP